jgi:hypothetical protein
MSTTTLKRKSASPIELQIRRAKAVLRDLQEALEDLEDRRALAKAKKRNGNKPGTPLAEVARELGIKLPARKS